MGKAVNLLNQRFGRLKVIEKTSKRNSSGSIYWRCECDCGNRDYTTTSSDLRHNHRKSCGCIQFEINHKKEFKELRRKEERLRRDKESLLKKRADSRRICTEVTHVD